MLSPDSLDLTQHLRPGDAIIWGQACAEPTTLLQMLQRQTSGMRGLSAFVGASFSNTLVPEHVGHIAMTSFGALGTNRRLVNAGLMQVIPCHVGLIGSYIEQGLIGCDVALLQLSPLGPDGRHSFGLSGDYVRIAADRARVVIAEINPSVPWLHGAPGLLPEEITVAIESNAAPVTVPAARVTDIDRAIAAHASAYIEDGSVLQMGIGGTPDAVMQSLHGRRDLGIHSGMVGDALVDLVQAGIVTNARKEIDRGISITGALIGSERLYRFADNNPALSLQPSSYTHDPAVLARLSRLVTINSAIEVDLTGQVNAEAIGADYLGGTGGQVDYVRAGHRSAGGHAIIALPASARGGISRIVAQLTGPVTTARSEVDVVITEHGAADLRGATLAERARRMINIAAPECREELVRAAHAANKQATA